MLPKNNRISRKEIPHILSVGKKHNSFGLLLYITPIDLNKKPKESKFAFSVSKKIYQKAVDRNKQKRRGYYIIFKNLKQIKPGYYLFFSFKKTPKPITYSVLEKEIKELLSLSGVLI